MRRPSRASPPPSQSGKAADANSPPRLSANDWRRFGWRPRPENPVAPQKRVHIAGCRPPRQVVPGARRRSPFQSPVCHGAVPPPQMWRLPEREALLGDQFLVHFDTESGRVRHRIMGSLQPGLYWEEVRVVEPEMRFSRTCAGFEPGKVRYGGREMEGRRRTDWPERVMRHHVNVVSFAPGSDLHRFRQSADVADIKAIVLVNVAFDVRLKLPFRGKFLS